MIGDPETFNAWRHFLYPLGFLANLAFSVRFFVQWSLSEAQKKSVVPPSFWHLSLFANLIMVLHATIQGQYAVSLVQGMNGAISWRNLNLMGPSTARLSFSSVLALFFAVFAAITALFIVQGYWLFNGMIPWAESPRFLDHPVSLSLSWHFFGTLGIFLFASRFWIQWWQAEREVQSVLPPSFWWCSLTGALLSILYFARMGDIVNLVGPAVGIIPYVRNLMLLRQHVIKKESIQ